MADHGEGYCVFNDVAVAVEVLQRSFWAKKILIIDCDVHQGNGTAKLLQKNEHVFTFSLHGEKNYPLRKEKSDLDIPLPDGTTGSQYLPLLEDTLPRLIDQVQPDILFYQSGVDVIAADKLGRLALSVSECSERDGIVFQTAFQHHLPVVTTMGGGYAPRIAHIIDAHANTFRVGKEIFY
jgi:acetoin utilization deacetylase AcuC-like enzyme